MAGRGGVGHEWFETASVEDAVVLVMCITDGFAFDFCCVLAGVVNLATVEALK